MAALGGALTLLLGGLVGFSILRCRKAPEDRAAQTPGPVQALKEVP